MSNIRKMAKKAKKKKDKFKISQIEKKGTLTRKKTNEKCNNCGIFGSKSNDWQNCMDTIYRW